MLSLYTSSSHLFFFSESGHVAYQIKIKEVQTIMQGNTLIYNLDLKVRYRNCANVSIFFCIKLSTKL